MCFGTRVSVRGRGSGGVRRIFRLDLVVGIFGFFVNVGIVFFFDLIFCSVSMVFFFFVVDVVSFFFFGVVCGESV